LHTYTHTHRFPMFAGFSPISHMGSAAIQSMRHILGPASILDRWTASKQTTSAERRGAESPFLEHVAAAHVRLDRLSNLFGTFLSQYDQTVDSPLQVSEPAKAILESRSQSHSSRETADFCAAAVSGPDVQTVGPNKDQNRHSRQASSIKQGKSTVSGTLQKRDSCSSISSSSSSTDKNSVRQEQHHPQHILLSNDNSNAALVKKASKVSMKFDKKAGKWVGNEEEADDLDAILKAQDDESDEDQAKHASLPRSRINPDTAGAPEKPLAHPDHVSSGDDHLRLDPRHGEELHRNATTDDESLFDISAEVEKGWEIMELDHQSFLARCRFSASVERAFSSLDLGTQRPLRSVEIYHSKTWFHDIFRYVQEPRT
jgi:hypothetical protein